MRLPFPERIPLPLATGAAVILVALQQLQGTGFTFSIYCFLFIVIATITFNMAGGFTRPSGGYVFFYSILGFILGIVWKAFLGEPGESNLSAPILTAQVFTAGITAMLFAVFVSRKLVGKRALLETVVKEKDMRNAAIGSLFVGTSISVASVLLPHGSGSIISAMMQVNRFLPLAVILGTTYVIKKSDGTRSMNGLLAVTLTISAFFGLVSFSKEGIFYPFMCWLVAACALRYRVSALQLAGLVLAAAFAVMFLVPYSQIGRNLPTENDTYMGRIQLSVSLLSDLGSLRDRYVRDQAENPEEKSGSYYDRSQGFMDRLTMIVADDALINITDKGSVFGLQGIYLDFANWVPHFLWPNKPSGGAGNYFAREIGGIIGDEDTTTGISFTPTGEAFHVAKWTGVLVVAPLIWILLFTIFDGLCGSAQKSPWGLLVVALFAHVAPEGMLGGAIYTMWYGAWSIIVAALAAAYLLPIIGTLIAGPEPTTITRRLRAPTGMNKPLPRTTRGGSLPA